MDLHLKKCCLSHLIPMSSMQMGLLAGGLADGSVVLYDPASVIDKTGNPLLAKMQKHTGPVCVAMFIVNHRM